jgi:WD40 repeat protein/serine/threonine protein kinase
MESLSGSYIKGYELKERIGAGGFGAVYRAHQSTVGREVAIKIILPGYANHPDFIRRFESEARLVARLEHMHITPLYDFWRDPEGAYFVMRLMQGGSLSAALRRDPYDLEAAAVLLDQIASALSVAHRKGIIHRDIKPSNILLDEDGNAYLADFGIAKDLGGGEGVTEADAVVGSPDYLAPEQARKEDVTPHTDIYSLGVVLYEMLTGEHPFPDQAPVARLFKHLNDPLPEVTTLDEEITGAINEVIQTATEKNPEKRYKDVLAMASAFREAAGLSPSQVAKSLVELLTPREQEVLQLIIDRKTNREIAEALSIELTTVKWYITQIYKKLKVRSRVQAIVRARELNLIVDGDLVIPPTDTSLTGLPEPENPYKGLRAFQAADEQDFFGREAITRKLLQRISEDGDFGRFLAVVGPSGSGKSSLVKASLIPALWRGELSGSERWFIIDMNPTARPLDELEVALLRVTAEHTEGLREQLERDEFGLVRVAKILLPDDGSELVIVIDQFEEVFNLVENEEVRTHFLDLLHTAVVDSESRVRVVITLRADFYDRPLNYVEFGQLVQNRTETVLPLSAEELERAIAQPAKRVGLKFEEGLVPAIIQDVHYQPGALPLLQYALTELFDERTNRTMTHEAYQKIGGTVGALANRAEEIFGELSEDSQEAARQMFLRLVTLGEGVEDTRRRVDRAELMAIAGEEKQDAMEELIDSFAAYRLLSLDNDPATRSPTVEVAHEALLREWDRLRTWLNESREDIRLQRQLATAAEGWKESDQDASYLLRGSRLEQCQRWESETELALTPLEQEYLQESISAREERQEVEAERQTREAALEQRSQRFLRALTGVFAAAAVIAIVLSGVAFNQNNIAQENASTAEAARVEADNQANAAATSAADAFTAQVEAEEETLARATAQADAEAQRHEALVQASIGLSSQAALELQGRSPERAVPLALEAIENYPYTWQAERALGEAVFSNHLKLILPHGGWVNSAVWSPDQSRILTAPDDGLAKVWDAVSGELVLTLEHEGEVFAAIWSPSGERILTNSWDIGAPQTLNIWDALTGELIYSMEVGAGNFWGADWSLDGKRIIASFESSGEEVGLTFVLDSQSGDSIFTLEATAVCGWPGCILGSRAWSPEGNRILTHDHEGGIQIWDAISGELIHQIQAHSDWINRSTWSPRGDRIVTASDDSTIAVWDASTGNELVTMQGHTGWVLMAAWSPTADHIVSAGKDGTARVWDAQTGEEIVNFNEHALSVEIVAWSPTGEYIVSGSEDGVAYVWEAFTGKVVQSLVGHDAEIGFANWSLDEQQVLTTGRDGSVNVWNLSSEMEVLHIDGREGAHRGIYWSPNGNRVARPFFDGTVEIYDTQSGELLLKIDAHQTRGLLASFSPSGKYIVTTSFDKKAEVWDAATGSHIASFEGHDQFPYSATWSPDGSKIASTSWVDQSIQIWDPMTGDTHLILGEHKEGVIWAEWSPDGLRIASVAASGEAFIWDAITGDRLLSLYPEEFEFDVMSLAWSPDGERLATHADDGFLRIWDAQTGEPLIKTPGHSGELWEMDWNPSREQIVSGDANGVIKIFDPETGAEVFSAHIPGYTDMALAPDGSRVATSSIVGGPIKIFSIWSSLDELIERAHACCVIRELTPEERNQFGLPPTPIE